MMMNPVPRVWCSLTRHDNRAAVAVDECNYGSVQALIRQVVRTVGVNITCGLVRFLTRKVFKTQWHDVLKTHRVEIESKLK